MKRIAIAAAVTVFAAATFTASRRAGADTPKPAATEAERVERGRALVEFGSCNDCHTPMKMTAKGPTPDMERMLSGHPENAALPAPPPGSDAWVMRGAASGTAFAGPWGISYAANLTSDRVTGVAGVWTEETFIKTMRTGRHWGVARPILPPMPWQSLNSLSDDDLKAIFAYLRTTKPVRNTVPDAVIAPPPQQVASK